MTTIRLTVMAWIGRSPFHRKAARNVTTDRRATGSRTLRMPNLRAHTMIGLAPTAAQIGGSSRVCARRTDHALLPGSGGCGRLVD